MGDRHLFLLALGRKKPGFGAIIRLDWFLVRFRLGGRHTAGVTPALTAWIEIGFRACRHHREAVVPTMACEMIRVPEQIS